MSIAARERVLLPALQSLPCVRRVKALPTADIEVSEVLIECTSDRPQEQIFRLLCGLDAPIRMMVQERESLERAFLQATAGKGNSEFGIRNSECGIECGGGAALDRLLR